MVGALRAEQLGPGPAFIVQATDIGNRLILKKTALRKIAAAMPAQLLGVAGRRVWMADMRDRADFPALTSNVRFPSPGGPLFCYLKVLDGEDTLVLEVDVRPANSDIGYAETLLSTHASGWAHKTVQAIESSGTDNALFLLDHDCVLRIPIRPSAVEPLTKELVWLPGLAELPLEVPKVLFHSQTKSQLGFDFGILTWLEGSVASEDRIDDPILAAGALGNFLFKLHQKPTKNAPHAGPGNNNRGVDLTELTEKTLSSIEVLADEIHADDARDLWQQACSKPFRGPPVWIHGDLKADNMLAQDGQLTAVIDWGLSAVGDPAVDIAAAWTWVAPEARAVFQSASGADDAAWKRAQGWALYCATIALSFYRGRSHEALCNQSRRTLQMLGLQRS